MSTTGVKSSMKQPEFLEITHHLFKEQEKSCIQGSIGFAFAFASPWLKNCYEILKHPQLCYFFQQSFENRSMGGKKMQHLRLVNNLLDHHFDFSAAIMIQSSAVTLKLAPMTLEYVPTQNSPWGLNL